MYFDHFSSAFLLLTGSLVCIVFSTYTNAIAPWFRDWDARWDGSDVFTKVQSISQASVYGKQRRIGMFCSLRWFYINDAFVLVDIQKDAFHVSFQGMSKYVSGAGIILTSLTTTLSVYWIAMFYYTKNNLFTREAGGSFVVVEEHILNLFVFGWLDYISVFSSSGGPAFRGFLRFLTLRELGFIF